MFKSIFAKYIITFTIIIVSVFIILGLLLGNIINNFFETTTKDNLYKINSSFKLIVLNGYLISNDEDTDYYISSSNYLKNDIKALTENDEIEIIIFNNNGINLLSSSSRYERISEDFLNQYKTSDKYYVKTTFDNYFDSSVYLYVSSFILENNLYFIITYSNASSIERVVSSLIKMLLMVSMWVMIAAIIASYFISERTVRPLRFISKAAKSFSSGDFGVRVPVIGNDEIAELAITFNNMAFSLEKIDDSRRSFISNVAHDLRSPLTTIIGFIDGILDGTIPADRTDYYLKIVNSEVKRLSRLVNQLLDITRIESGERKFDFKPFDICELTKQILISFEQRINKKQLDVEFNCPEEKEIVLGDIDAINQVIYNIIDNAIKFSYDNGLLKFSIFEADKNIVLSIYNTGIGVKDDDIPYLFDRFYKADKSRGKDKTGVGLGMYIAKTIIDVHEGKIEVKSKYEEYCEFIISLKKYK